MIGCLWHSTAAQNPVNMKFGKPTKEEMQMTEYAPDPNADAVMLCRLTDVNYTVQQKGFLVDYHERIRIKVLKPEGARFASVTIPYTILNQEKTGPKASKLSLNARYFSVGSISSSSFEQAGNSVTEDAVGTFVEEDVQEPKATAYNMENGKVKKTKLRSSDIVKEKVGDESYEVRFTVPDVRQGTVIEYEYTIHSQLFYRLRDWTAQCDMPVAFARLEMDIPVYLAFNIEEHGIQRLNCTCTTSSLTYKNLLVERAHLLTMGKSGSSVNLQKTVRSQTMTIVNATLANDGTMSGTQTTQYRGLSAQHYRQKTGKTDEFAMEATEEEKFTIKGDVNHDTIHIVPFYMPPLAKNCFTSDKRLMPVEFPSEMSQQVVVNITLPEGYTLAEIPQQVAASTPDKSISGIYFVSQTDNKVQIDFQFKINKVLHQVENYDKLRGIFDLFHKCSTQSIAIKKL